MKIADLVKNKIDRFAEGYVFTYSDFNIEVKKESALKIALCRLVKSGKIQRVSKGKFYKPKQGIVGKLNPNEYEVVKDLLKDGNKIIGYITGYGIFNKFGLTTQVPNIIQIGSNVDKKGLKRGIYTIKFVRQWNKITKRNANINSSFKRISGLISELPENEQAYLSELAINYPPACRALTGALFENLGQMQILERLNRTLKSTTWYDINISDNLIRNKKKWRIK